MVHPSRLPKGGGGQCRKRLSRLCDDQSDSSMIPLTPTSSYVKTEIRLVHPAIKWGFDSESVP
jgi:hypothetical protein